MDKHKRFLLLLVVALLVFTSCKKHTVPVTAIEQNRLLWVKEECHFVDYIIKDDTIIFRYSFCFDNQSRHDIIISSFTASFAPKELEGWVAYNDFFFGKTDQPEILIHDGEKAIVTISFEGDYLGGEVNEDLSCPVEIMFVQSIAQNDAVNGSAD